MGNLSGWGTSFVLGRTSCEPWKLLTIVRLGQFRWWKCLCSHFWCQIEIQTCLCNINISNLLLFSTSCHTFYFNSVIHTVWVCLCSLDMILSTVIVKTTCFFPTTVLFQVADGRGNCTPHRNPTPCTIPQDRESIFHSIFAFFTKSGRKVLVNM